MVCTSGKCGSRPEHMLPRELLVASFFAQSVVVFASNGGYLGGLTNVEVGEKYRTLFMPAGWAFAIWGLIYAWELMAYGSALFDPHPSPQLEAAAANTRNSSTACRPSGAFSTPPVRRAPSRG